VATYRKRDYTPRLRGRKLDEYGRIMLRERQQLIVSEDRRLWILRHYPPHLNGEGVLVKDDEPTESPTIDEPA
jgi:hypothetical protein